MIKMPLSQIIEKIKEKANISEEEINEKIKQKLDQLSGLISKEGAAHIVANELGVKLVEQTGGKLQINNILAGMRNVETVGKVQQIFPVNEFNRKDGSKGKVGSLVLGDETGTIRLVLWNEQTEKLNDIKEGDILKIGDCYARENQARLEVHLNDKSKFLINPEGEKVGEVKQTTPVSSTIRKKISELNEKDLDVELVGTIVQVFDPRFYEVCPECNKRARMREDAFYCDVHNKVTPNYSYVMNLFLDDGTENIRAVFFKNQAEKLMGINGDDMLKYKDSPEKFEEVKTKLLGNQIKLIGRVNKNDMFNRLEFVTRMVFEADPKEELEKLKKESTSVPEQKPAEFKT